MILSKGPERQWILPSQAKERMFADLVSNYAPGGIGKHRQNMPQFTASPVDSGLFVAHLHSLQQRILNYQERILSLIVVEEISLFADHGACSFSSEMSCNHNWNIKKQGQITKQLISSAVLVKSYVGFSVMEKSPFPRAWLELSGQLLDNPVPRGHLEHHGCKN